MGTERAWLSLFVHALHYPQSIHTFIRGRGRVQTMSWYSRGLACGIFYLFHKLVHHQQDHLYFHQATHFSDIVSKRNRSIWKYIGFPNPAGSWPHVNMISIIDEFNRTSLFQFKYHFKSAKQSMIKIFGNVIPAYCDNCTIVSRYYAPQFCTQL